MPFSGPEPPATRTDLVRNLSLLEDGVAAARRRLDDAAALVAAVEKPIPASLAAVVSEATANLRDVETRRDEARALAGTYPDGLQ